MDTQQFDLSFRLKGKTLKAIAQKFQVAELPQIRVAVDIDKKVPEVYVFYVDNGKLFWYPLSGIKGEMAAAIAKKIKNIKPSNGLLN